MTSVQEHWHRSQFDDQLSSGQSMQFLQLIPGTCWSKHRLLAAPSHWGQAPGTPGFVPQLCHPAVEEAQEKRGTCGQRTTDHGEATVSALGTLPSWSFGSLGQRG